MAPLRVIAVENITASDSSQYEPVVACVYKNDTLYVYDSHGELLLSKEYFPDLKTLNELIERGKFEWADFYINMGEIVKKDIHGNVIINEDLISPISRLNEAEEGEISPVSIKLYFEFLKTINKDKPAHLETLKMSYEKRELKQKIEAIIEENPLKKLLDTDKKLIIMTRLQGPRYIINHVKKLLKSNESYSIDEIHFLFSRLFKLEKSNYINLL